MNCADAEKILLEVAREYDQRGPGYAQEPVVIREAASRLEIGGDLEAQQVLLTCWHELFRRGDLSWGYNLDTPSSPWFHFTKR